MSPRSRLRIDLGLPRPDGYALARAIRALPGGEAVYLAAGLTDRVWDLRDLL